MRWMHVVIAMLCYAAPLGCDASGEGDPTGSVCATGSSLTWTEFGQDFMTSYCTRCHGRYRNQAGVQRDLAAVDRYAAAGPDATNTGMPTNGSKPTVEERRLLGEWLACGAP